VQSETTNERYLRLPVYISRSKKKAFQYLKDHIWRRIRLEGEITVEGRNEILIWHKLQPAVMQPGLQPISPAQNKPRYRLT
jgi:hypothetical protein